MTPENKLGQSSFIISGLVVVVDSEDIEKIMALSPWRKHGGSRNQYFQHSMARPSRDHILLHRFIINAKLGEEVDHINGDTLDNRKANLRICSHAQNQRNMKKKNTNTSGFKGVSLDKQKTRWRARITINGKEKTLGAYATPLEAYSAYCIAAKDIHGEFARLA